MKKKVVTLFLLFFFWMVSNVGAEALTFEEEVVLLVNEEREKYGLSVLTHYEKLASVAQTKINDMIKHHYFDHVSPTYGTPFQMMKKLGIACSIAGENIARGQRTPEEVMEDWMNSESHRRNILYQHYEKIGVAYENGLWVQLFIK